MSPSRGTDTVAELVFPSYNLPNTSFDDTTPQVKLKPSARRRLGLSDTQA
jgi:hypothetical protein